MLEEKGKIRQLVLFSIGINSALRISDLLSIQVIHLFNKNGEVNDSFTLKEKKTGKSHKVALPKKTKASIELYKIAYPNIITKKENYIFFRAKSNTRGANPFSRIQGWKYIGQRCKAVGLSGNYGGHTLRKTRGYHARIKGVPLSVIQHKLNHSSQKVTLRYIGITQQEVDEAVHNLDL